MGALPQSTATTSSRPAPSRALQSNPQAPRRRYRLAYWTPAVAQTTAPRLSAFGHHCCSCPAAAAPLRRPAITPLASLRLAGGYLGVIWAAPSRGKTASRLCLSCYRRTASADFCPWPPWSRSARRLRRQHKAAHGSSGYAGAPLAVLHFVARRRLPAVKRTAAMPGVSACKVKTVPPAALRIHSAATRPTSCRVPPLS